MDEGWVDECLAGLEALLRPLGEKYGADFGGEIRVFRSKRDGLRGGVPVTVKVVKWCTGIACVRVAT